MFWDEGPILRISPDDDSYYKTAEEAIRYLRDFQANDVCIYNISEKDAKKEVDKVIDYIREINKGRPLNEQFLLMAPYKSRGIIGSLGVNVFEISLRNYERSHNNIPMSPGGWDESVLDTSKEEADLRPSLKALANFGAMFSKDPIFWI